MANKLIQHQPLKTNICHIITEMRPEMSEIIFLYHRNMIDHLNNESRIEMEFKFHRNHNYYITKLHYQMKSKTE